MSGAIYDCGGNPITAVPLTHRVRAYKQPRGGLIPVKGLSTISLGNGMDELPEGVGERYTVIGAAVEYLCRFVSGSTLEDSFRACLYGALTVGDEEFKNAQEMLYRIKGLDDVSISNALKLVRYDIIQRGIQIGVGINPYLYVPDIRSIQAVRMMVHRFNFFLDVYGPKVRDGFLLTGCTFKYVSECEIDFVTEDMVWDFKVLADKFTAKHTLQVALYWRAGLRSYDFQVFEKTKYLGLYNPRQNIVSYIRTDTIPASILKIIDNDVLGVL